MNVEKMRRYKTDRRGSFTISVHLADWELAITIAALNAYIKAARSKRGKPLPKATVAYARNLSKGYGRALGILTQKEKADVAELRTEYELTTAIKNEGKP